jgi:hypothetical protein
MANLILPLFQAVVGSQRVDEEVAVKQDWFAFHHGFQTRHRISRIVDTEVNALARSAHEVDEADASVPPAAVLIADL